MADLLGEVARFRSWAEKRMPADSGGWETEYPEWPSLYAAVLAFVESRPSVDWSDDELESILYAIARDNEDEHIVSEMQLRFPEVLSRLAAIACDRGEWNARWQLAHELGAIARPGGADERVLLRFATDEHEYVRRRALGALAQMGSGAVERLALEAWDRDDPHQEWSRMAALGALHAVQSPKLLDLLRAAEEEPRPHLRAFAGRLRNGKSE